MSRSALIDLPPNDLDVALADACAGIARPSLERTFQVMTYLVDEKPLLAAAALAWLCVRSTSDNRRLKRGVDQMLCSVAIAGALPHTFKRIVARERPDRVRVHGRRHGIPKSGNPWDSFPSGHAVHVGALAHAVAPLVPRKVRPLLWPIAAALSGTRVILLAHYLSDVLAGLAFGIAIDKFVARQFDRAAKCQR
jgi:membrane-associated phospholipid phosphatase